MTEKKKPCRICGRAKLLSEFSPNKEMRDGHINQCRLCIRKRKYRPTQKAKYKHSKKWVKRWPEKHAAQQAAHRAVKAGILVPQPCQVCGASKVERHHPSYKWEDRWKVEWLCPKHHRAAHKYFQRGKELAK